MIPAPEGYAWPPGTGWAWRPGLSASPVPLWPAREVPSGEAIAGPVKAFHDGGAAVAPHTDGFAIWGTGGEFLSLVVDLPGDGAAHLSSRHILTVAGRAALKGERTLYARLNVRHGPNTAQQTRGARIEDGLLLAEFDLAYLDLRHAILSAGWVDLIVDDPRGICLSVTDLTLSHRPRAEL
ncbi:MAG: DUF6478 family protein [Pseudomonadota bacterium]